MNTTIREMANRSWNDLKLLGGDLEQLTVAVWNWLVEIWATFIDMPLSQSWVYLASVGGTVWFIATGYAVVRSYELRRLTKAVTTRFSYWAVS